MDVQPPTQPIDPNVGPTVISPTQPVGVPQKSASVAGRPLSAPIQPQPVQPQVDPNAQPYDFIMSPEKPARKLGLPGSGSSMAVRIGLIAGGLVILFIVFSLIKGVVAPKPSYTGYITVAQDQQALIHIVGSAELQKGLTKSNQNFVATASLVLPSNQSQVLTYLTKNGQKVDAKILALRISSTTDSQLQDAAAATTFNATFKDVMTSKLATYDKDLKAAYAQSKGEKGRAMLNDLYNQSSLLQAQLKTN